MRLPRVTELKKAALQRLSPGALEHSDARAEKKQAKESEEESELGI